MKRYLGLAGLLLVSACATPLENGVAAYNGGDYDAAAKNWNAAAAAGDPNAQYNLGLLWEQGLGSTPRDAAQAAEWYLKAARQGQVQAMVALARYQLALGYRQQAISWLNLAARWNSDDARALLAQEGVQAPAADLFAAHQQGTIAQQQALGELGYATGRLAAGGCPRSGYQQPIAQRGSALPIDLRDQWYASGAKMCRYADGTVLNVGWNSCPPSIAGR